MARMKNWGSAVRGLVVVAMVVLAAVVLVQRAGGGARPPGTAPSGVAGGSSAAAGADLSFIEYQAEEAETNARIIGPDWAYGTVASEAVGRQAVLLENAGDHVEFTLDEPANAVNVRLSIPDSEDGAGIDDTLGVYVDGERLATVDVTSRYSWYYGVFPWSNEPADGGPRQVFGDSRVLLGQTLPAGSTVRLEIGDEDSAPWYAIDLADFEEVAPAAQQPDGALSILEFGADPTGEDDSSDAIQDAIDAGSEAGRTVWIPEGTFTVTRHLIVDEVTLQGAGPWHSVLTGDGVGVYGNFNPAPSTNVHLSDFAIFGEVDERVDDAQVNAIGGALGDSTIDNIWMQHTKVGMWLDGPFDNLHVTRARILSQTADGLNFHNGVTNSSVTNSYIRSTGDDGMAMWSYEYPNRNNSFAHNTVKVPALANNIVIYGGTDNDVSGNWVTDTVTQGGGIQVANRFGAPPLEGTTTVIGNRLDRTGSLDLFRHDGNGAMQFWAEDSAMTGEVEVRENVVTDSAYSAVQFLGQDITNVTFEANSFEGAGSHLLQLDAPGSATFTDTAAGELGAVSVLDCDSGFEIIDEDGNSGWGEAACDTYVPGPLEVSDLGEELTFLAPAIGEQSAPQTVTVSNPSSSAVDIASITSTATYTVSHDCGTVLEAGASCEITLVFTASATGDSRGALTISDGTSAGRYQVYVDGQVGE